MINGRHMYNTDSRSKERASMKKNASIEIFNFCSFLHAFFFNEGSSLHAEELKLKMIL